MQKTLLFLISFTAFLSGFSQVNKTNLIVFSEDGDKFYLVINGIRQNMKSETNIKVTDLTAENFSFTVIFEDTKIPSIKKTQSLPLGNEYTYRIKSDKKGNKVLKYFGEIALNEAPKNSDAATIVYHTTENPVTTTENVVTTNTSAGSNSSGNSVSVGTTNSGQTTTTSTTTTTTSVTNGSETTGVGMNVDIKDQGNGGNVSTGVNAGGVGMNIDINVSENGASINMGGTGMNIDENATTNSNSSTGTTTTYSSTTTTTTTTTSSTGGGVSTGVNAGGNNVSVNTQVTGTGINTGTNTGASSAVSSNVGSNGCSYPMGTSDFDTAKKSIDSKDFEDSKFTVAKQVTKGNCLNATQIKEVMQLFDFEATKLDYAKFAYDYCYDKNNYFKLNDAFDFESSVDELNEYIEKK